MLRLLLDEHNMRKGHENTRHFARFTEFTSQNEFGTDLGYPWGCWGPLGSTTLIFTPSDTMERRNPLGAVLEENALLLWVETLQPPIASVAATLPGAGNLFFIRTF